MRKQQPVLGGYEPDLYASERLHATASDGTRIPISLVYRKDTPRDGSAPLLLYGYGSYGISVPVSFNSNRLSLLDRAVVFAIAHVRGGGELGKPWHDAGRPDNIQRCPIATVDPTRRDGPRDARPDVNRRPRAAGRPAARTFDDPDATASDLPFMRTSTSKILA